ncbi:uncharacterized protein LOC141601361 [Silene latifolia]|uniref:uncharacterized protein LOC141601361 n=1 Tax=Silene latifolia TaxID=37657 RepID=UPI003D77FADA
MHSGGRLWVLWNPANVQVQVLARGAQFLQCSLLHHACQKHVVTSFIYALNRAADRMDLWDNLRQFSTKITLLWVCLGDFNISFTADERDGCIPHDREMHEFRDCLADCALSDHPYTGGLYTWHNKQEKSPKWRVAEAKASLTHYRFFLQPSSLNQLLLVENKALTANYIKPKNAEMRILAQKAKVQHLIDVRKSRNTIGIINDGHGRVYTGHDEIAQAFLGYYKSLLGSEESAQPHPPELFSHHTHQDVAHLDSMVTPQEIRATLSSIDRNKSQGVDGYSSGFFKDTWDITCLDFTTVVMEFFKSGKMPRAANSTLIAPILKKEAPKPVTEFRAISCCIVFYKRVSKILANRMKVVLGLRVNPMKSILYLGGVSHQLKQLILATTGYVEGNLPVRYLGSKGHVHYMYKTLGDVFNFPKHVIIGLLAAQNKLPTVDNLCHTGLMIVNRCVLCGSHSKTVAHLFFECPFSATVWSKVAHWLKITPLTQLQKIFHWRIYKGLQSPSTAIIWRVQYLVLTRLSTNALPFEEFLSRYC